MSGGLRVPAPLRAALLALAASACVLEDVEITDVEDVVVAEVLVQIRDDGAGAFRPAVFALLHRSALGEEAGRPVEGARVVVLGAGAPIPLGPRPVVECASDLPAPTVTCLRASAADEQRVGPGDSLSVEIELPEGGVLRGFTVVPEAFALIAAPPQGSCVMQPDTHLELRWTRSPGAWAYLADAAIHNLGHLEPGSWLPQSGVRLTGLSVSDADTTLVFPGEFGLPERFSEEPAVLVRLQQGIPGGAFAEISVAAAERNYANWHRGGVFNPAGPVRVPSLRGSGTGFFGAVVVRTLAVWSPPRSGWDPAEEPPCA